MKKPYIQKNLIRFTVLNFVLLGVIVKSCAKTQLKIKKLNNGLNNIYYNNLVINKLC